MSKAESQNQHPRLPGVAASTDCGCGERCDTTPPSIDRRGFVQTVAIGAGLAAWRSSVGAVAGPFDAEQNFVTSGDHLIPTDKKLSQEWVRTLYARGSRTWRTGDELKTIGMPIGGVGAGQVYLTGDGRLVYWGIDNTTHSSGYGDTNYQAGRGPTDMAEGDRPFFPAPDVEQGVALRVVGSAGSTTRTLDAKGFPGVRFCGEYPVAEIEFADASAPVKTTLEAFSPFIPLNAKDSALPATLLRYTVENQAAEELEVTLAAWLQNATLQRNADRFASQAVRRNRVVRGEGLTAVEGTTIESDQPAAAERPPIVFADFESDEFQGWSVEGAAFGDGPSAGVLPDLAAITGFQGEGLADSRVGGVESRGRLTSREFVIERAWVSLLVGGSALSVDSSVNLVVDGKTVRTALGDNDERLTPRNWDVREFVGQSARIVIFDSNRGGWGHIAVDQIEFRDSPLPENSFPLRSQPDFGGMTLAVLDNADTFASADLAAGPAAATVFDTRDETTAKKPLDKRLRGSVGKTVRLKPGERATVTFLVTWWMPNNYNQGRWVGNAYAKRFDSSLKVARYVAENYDRLHRGTRLWLDTYYDSTLPRWLLDRVGATTCNLATQTCQWWANGRFWAWEGVGCCHGTCGHVWNYEHALARLFPSLERSVRTMQDFDPAAGFDEATGAIGFRGEGWDKWAGDAQGGYILKAYREHQCSADDAFLREYWPRIRKATEFLIEQDGDSDGLIEGRQHQTYDRDYYGANTMVGSLYLGALRAAEEMATEIGDDAFAHRCRTIFDSGRRHSEARLYNGEYFIQDVDLQEHPDWQYAGGCLADQMIGQGWAHQVGLGYLYSREKVNRSLESVWRYCWAPDVALQSERHKPNRWFAKPGEAGMFTCTWPKSERPGPRPTCYKNEVWSGIEYQVANHLAWEGMLTESLAICRAVHERYDPIKRNPFNEIECGDHYARAMASWAMLTSLAGFEHHGPRGHLGFAPRITPEDFRVVFTTAEAWGTFAQQIQDNTLTAQIDVKQGQLRLSSLSLALPDGARRGEVVIDVSGTTVNPTVTQKRSSAVFDFANPVHLQAGGQLSLTIQLLGPMERSPD